MKTLSELWLEVGGPFWAKNDTGWYFYCTGISPNELCVGWNENGSSSCWDADTDCWTLLDHDPTKPKPKSKKRVLMNKLGALHLSDAGPSSEWQDITDELREVLLGEGE